MARALAAAIVVAVLAVSGASGVVTQQTPKRGGSLVFAMPQPEFACLNPTIGICAPGGSTAWIPLQAILHRVLEAPFQVGADFTWEPRLVSDVDYTTTAPFTLTYHIRREARWSDGVPVTARDFVFTHRAILDYDGSLGRSASQEGLEERHQRVRRIRAVNQKTVRVVLRSRMGTWRGLFGGILPSHALRGEDLKNVWHSRIDNPKTGRPIGSGPFLVERWERGRQLTLVRNPRYWGRHPARLGRLVVRFGLEGDDVRDALRRREISVAFGFPPGFASDVRGEAALRLVSAPATGWEHLDMRIGPGGNPLLKMKTVRRAIAYGIDRAAIVRELVRDSGLNFTATQSTMFLTRSRYYRANWARYRYRPMEARRLLERSGCRSGSDGIYRCRGVRLSLRSFTHVAPGSLRPRVLALIQRQLQPAGVEVVPTFSPQDAVFGSDGIYARGDYDIAVFAWVKDEPALSHKTIFGCGGSQNWMGYCQRLVTADLDQAERILTADRQARVLNKADIQIARDVPMLPLFEHTIWAGLTREVRGVGLHAFDALLGAEDWWLDR